MSAIINNNIISVINPISQESVAKLKCSLKEEVLDIIDITQQYEDWRYLSLRKRCIYINKLRKVILKNKDELKDTKIVYMIHEISDLYNFDSGVYKKLNINLDKKSKVQNNVINSISLSDYVYIYNDENKTCEKYINKHKKIKKALKNTKHEFIDYSDSLDVSERIEVYNHILAKLKK